MRAVREPLCATPNRPARLMISEALPLPILVKPPQPREFSSPFGREAQQAESAVSKSSAKGRPVDGVPPGGGVGGTGGSTGTGAGAVTVRVAGAEVSAPQEFLTMAR